MHEAGSYVRLFGNWQVLPKKMQGAAEISCKSWQQNTQLPQKANIQVEIVVNWLILNLSMVNIVDYDIEAEQFPAKAKSTSGFVSGEYTEVMSVEFRDKILFTIV